MKVTWNKDKYELIHKDGKFRILLDSDGKYLVQRKPFSQWISHASFDTYQQAFDRVNELAVQGIHFVLNKYRPYVS